MKKKIAIYPGSFNPFHNGHLNILEKAEAIFDEVIIAVGDNPEKAESYTEPGIGSLSTFTVKPDRVKTIKVNLPSKNVESFKGFLPDFVSKKESEGHDVTIIRGLRNGDDLAYETNKMRFMQEAKRDLKIVFIVCDAEFSHISSSDIRDIQSIEPAASIKYIAREK